MTDVFETLRKFNLTQFRRGQQEIIETVLNRQDTLAVMPTGQGKSLCFQLPAFHWQQTVLVISPLIALMKDQVASLRSRGLAAGALHSGQSYDEKRQIFSDLESKNGYVLYLSPERVQNPGFEQWFKKSRIALVAIDEAHCVSEWGHDFREEYSLLKCLRTWRADVPLLALTATATPRVLSDIAKTLTMKNPEKHVFGFYRPNLYFQVETCLNDQEKMRFLYEAIERTPEGRIIIYSGTRKKCEELCEELAKTFSQVHYYHAGLSSEERTDIQERYQRSDIRILCATVAFGLGVDQPDVRLVVHFQLPKNIDSYYQEMGRAGRDGKDSTCLLLYAAKDKGLQSYFLTNSTAPKNILQERWRGLNTFIEYVESFECRHAAILTYFRDRQRLEACGHCDVCAPDSPRKIPKPSRKMPAVSQKATKARKKSKDATKITSPLDQVLYDELKSWRIGYARERDIPAFVVFSDRTLQSLVVEKPSNLTELEEVYGFGPHKVKAIGKEVLRILASR